MKNLFKNLSLIAILLSFVVLPVNTQATKPLPGNFGTLDYAEKMIQQAEAQIFETDERLNEIRKLGISIPSESEILRRIENYKKQFELAKKYFKNRDYFKVSSHASQSRAGAEVVFSALVRILRGEITSGREIPQLGTKEYLLDIGETVNLGEVSWIKMTLLNISDSNIADIKLQIKEKSNKISLRKGQSYNMEGELFIYFEGVVYFSGEENKKGEFSVTIQDDLSPIIELEEVPIGSLSEVPVEELIETSVGELTEVPIGELVEFEIYPDKYYLYKSIKECAVVKYSCSFGTRHFNDEFGCGCAVIKDKLETRHPKELVEFSVLVKDEEKELKEVIVKFNPENNFTTIKAVSDVSRPTSEDCNEYLKGCKAGDNTLGDDEVCRKREINCEKTVTIAKTKETLEIKENKIFVNEKEVKIMPDTASEKAIQALQLKKEVKIELKDTGRPSYEIIGKKEVKIFGLFKKEMRIKSQVNAETGEIEKVKKPWWSFLVF